LKKGQKDILANISMISQIGLTMVISIFGGIFIGNYLDNLLGTGSILLVVGILLGVGGAFSSLFRVTKGQTRNQKNKETPDDYVRKFEQEVQSEKKKNNNEK